MQTTDLKQAASGAADKSRSFINKQIDDRSTQLGTSISSTAGDLRRIADELRSSGTVAGTAEIADRGADAIDKVGQYLQSASGEQLIADAETFARERPWAIAVAAATLGFTLSRFIKASSAQRYHSSYSDSGSYGSDYAARGRYEPSGSSYAGTTGTSASSSYSGSSMNTASSGSDAPYGTGASPTYAR